MAIKRNLIIAEPLKYAFNSTRKNNYEVEFMTFITNFFA